MTLSSDSKQNTDDLLSRLKTLVEDDSKVNTLNELGKTFLTEAEFSTAKEYFHAAEKLALELDFKKGLADSLSHMGRVYEFEGDYVNSLEFQFSSLKIRESINDKAGVSYSLHYIGDIFLSQGDLADDFQLVTAHTNRALEQFFKSLQVAEEIDDKKSIANTFNCLGNSYRQLNHFSEAIDYYLKALKLRESIGDKQGFAVTYNNIGKLYIKQHDYVKANEFLLKSLQIAEEIGDNRAIVKALGSIGNCYLKEKDFSKALEYYIKSLQIAKRIGFLESIVNANYALSEIYEDKNFKEHDNGIALTHYKEYVKGRDQLNSKKLAQAELKFEFERKIAATKAEQDKKDAIAIAMQNKNKEILDSIHYARRIQRSLLPTEKYIIRVLKQK